MQYLSRQDGKVSQQLPIILFVALLCPVQSSGEISPARDLGVVVGQLEPGPNNAITDVSGVRVGHETIIRGESGSPHFDDQAQRYVDRVFKDVAYYKKDVEHRAMRTYHPGEI